MLGLTIGTQAAQVVGTTSAKFGVTPGGAASYSIPIAMPKGTADMQPKLALQYNSQDRNSIMGVGWRVTGLSYINRCQTNLYMDDPAKGGVGIDPVDYDDNDKFCLNGERLMAVKGAYGADGTEYRTFFEEFSKVISHGSSATGPTSFTVYKKTGEILTYGGTEDSRFRRNTQDHIRTWALSKLADAKGNYISYSYFNDRPNGEFYINRIDYTGNDAQGLSPYNHVSFLYEDRDDKISHYKAGDKIVLTKRLSKIQVFTESQLAHEYRVAYGAGDTERSRVTSITECADSETCFKPTVFEWNEGKVGPESGDKSFKIEDASFGGSSLEIQRYQWESRVDRSIRYAGDYNGDGLTDFLESYGEKYFTVIFSKGDGTFETGPTDSNSEWKKIHTGDFNGDGLTDFIGTTNGTPHCILNTSRGDGTFSKKTILNDPSFHCVSIEAAADFDGDGRSDLYISRKATGVISSYLYERTLEDELWISQGDGTFKKTILNGGAGIPTRYALSTTGDFDGDGRTDLYLHYSEDYDILIDVSTPKVFGKDNSKPDLIMFAREGGVFDKHYMPVSGDLPEGHLIAGSGDFNGDGLTDFYSILFRENMADDDFKNDDINLDHYEDGFHAVKPVHFWFSKGDGTFEKKEFSFVDSNGDPGIFKVNTIPDANGDGTDDLLIWYKGHNANYDNRDIIFGKSNNTFSTPIAVETKSTGEEIISEILVGKFSSNGLGSYLSYKTEQHDVYSVNTAKIHQNSFLPPEKITSATNGHGLNTRITYSPLTDSAVYTKGTNAQYPTQDAISSRYVVSKVDADNGTGSQNSQTYIYEGLQYHLRGLRNLGFSRMLLTDVTTGIKTETIYNQDWSNLHHGLLKESRTIAPDNTVLNENILNWKSRGFLDQNGKTASFFRYVDNTSSTKRDLNGSIISTGENSNEYDDLGFETKIVTKISDKDQSFINTKTATNTYDHNLDAWRLGMLKNSTVVQNTGNIDGTSEPTEEIITSTENEVIEENFDGSLSGWSNNKTESGLSSGKFLGQHSGSGGNQYLSKTYTFNEVPNQITIEFDFHEIGYWTNDDFKIFVNNQEVAKDSFTIHPSALSNHQPSVIPSEEDTHNYSTTIKTGELIQFDPMTLTTSTVPVQTHRFKVTVPVNETSKSIKIGFGSDDAEWSYYDWSMLLQKSLPGTWGIDNLKITATRTIEQVIEVEAPPPTVSIDETKTVTNTTTFTYDTDGYLLSTTKEPGNALSHTATNTLNAYGVIESVTETWGSTDTDGLAATSRTTSFEFDPKVRFVTKETNPLGHTETKTYHPILGIVASTTGPNGLTTTFDHDVFGRVIKENKVDGTTTDSAMEFCSTEVPCPTGAVYRLRSVKSDGSEKLVYMNKLNLEIKMSALLDNRWTHAITEYDEIGREKRKTQPHFDGETLHWTTNTYDILDRVTRIDRPDGSFQTATFNGLTKVSTNELGQIKTVTKNVIQKDAAITNHEGHTITYTYDGAGQLLTMTANGEVTSYAYDIRGNKISDSDPDKGTWTYRYNALGKIVEQTNAKGETTTMTYDVLDRMLSRIDDANGANPSARTSSWEYDTATNGIGKIHKIISPTYTITNSYDTLGRPITTQETIDGENFTTSTTYDSQSRPDTTSYPSGVVTKNTYDAQGTLLKVANNNSAETWWERLEVDARGNVTKAKHGNGVETMRTFDPTTGRLTSIYSYKGAEVIQDLTYTKDYLGNLTRREDKRLNQVETFVYDNLNRVTQVDTTVAGSTNTVTMTYGITGNILTKSDVGTYTYGQVHASCGTSFAGPHAVTTVSGTKNATYCYDANGNMTSGDGRTTTYTAFDKPTQITKGGNTVNFYYGPDRKRFKRIDNTVADGTKITIYAAGKAYERITDANGVKEKHYVGDFAVITKNSANGGTLRTSYMHRDHLGSVDVLTDETGTVQQRMSFDTWGKRREINWQQMTEAAITTFDTSITTRGFTGHEQIDQVGLVHMNGRVYEPELGRFLSADPILEAIDNLQTYNRYSYVRNNPVTHTDPSGFTTSGEGDTGDAGQDISAELGYEFGVDYGLGEFASVSVGSDSQESSNSFSTDSNGKINQTHDTKISFRVLSNANAAPYYSYLRGELPERTETSLARYTKPNKTWTRKSGKSLKGFFQAYVKQHQKQMASDNPPEEQVALFMGYTHPPAFAAHGSYHSFVIALDLKTGKMSINRAGPSINSEPYGLIIVRGLNTIYDNMAPWSDRMQTADLGHIQADVFEDWSKSTFDKSTATQAVQYLSMSKKNINWVIKNMHEFKSNQNQARVDYLARSRNSNSYAFSYAEHIMGVRPEPMVTVWAWRNNSN